LLPETDACTTAGITAPASEANPAPLIKDLLFISPGLNDSYW